MTHLRAMRGNYFIDEAAEAHSEQVKRLFLPEPAAKYNCLPELSGLSGYATALGPGPGRTAFYEAHSRTSIRLAFTFRRCRAGEQEAWLGLSVCVLAQNKKTHTRKHLSDPNQLGVHRLLSAAEWTHVFSELGQDNQPRPSLCY